MSAAQRLAAQRALAALGRPVDVVLADGKWDFVSTPESRYRTQMIVKGDRVSLSIAAASVLAKVTRDRQMRLAAEHYPQYHFDSNKGYPCPRHIMALNGYGASAIHRTSWAFMGNLPWSCGLRGGSEQGQERLFSGL
jgi:ribonuclease HII